MKPPWFTVAVLATALAMALAALPSFGGVGGDSAPANSPLKNPLLSDPDPAPAQPIIQSPFNPAPAAAAPPAEVPSPPPPAPKPVQMQTAPETQPAPEPKPAHTEPPETPAQTLQAAPAEAVAAPTSRPSGDKGLDWTASAFVVTPILGNQYNSAFKSYGLTGLVSIALPKYYPNFDLRAEAGFGFMYSKFASSFAAFNHVYFDFPLRVRLLYPLNDKGLIGEAYVGAVLRFFQYNDDSRILGGPLYKNTSGVFNPDLAIGVTYPALPSLRLRALLGLVYFSVGAEYSFF